MHKLDLHNVSHADAEILIDNFIIKYYENLPIEIITGNSIPMIDILKMITKKHDLRMSPSHLNNLGSYIINHKLK